MPTLECLAEQGTSSLFVEPPEVFGVIADGQGRVLFTDVSNHRIFRLAREGGVEAVVGTGEAGNDGDGGPATEAAPPEPRSVVQSRTPSSLDAPMLVRTAQLSLPA